MWFKPNKKKTCLRCKVEKHLFDYQRHVGYPDGLQTICKICLGISMKNFRRLKLYGLTEQDYLRIVDEQNGACKICHRIKRLVCDHDHITGAFRGLICQRCNIGLGYFNDSVELFERAVDYIEGNL